MDFNRTRHLLRAAAVIGWGVAAAVVAAAAMLPSPMPPARSTRPATRPATSPAAPALDDAAFAPLMTLALRRPLFDAPPAPKLALAPATSPTSVGLALRGTIVEAGGASCAVFTLAGGKVAIAAIGQRVDGAEVIAIDRDAVTVRYGNDARPVTLRVPPPGEIGPTPATVKERR